LPTSLKRDRREHRVYMRLDLGAPARDLVGFHPARPPIAAAIGQPHRRIDEPAVESPQFGVADLPLLIIADQGHGGVRITNGLPPG
jgi:hypothetical protein